jgi:hypothetical protein
VHLLRKHASQWLQAHECIVCDRTFKTERALRRHEGGQGHQLQLRELKLQMHVEDALVIE